MRASLTRINEGTPACVSTLTISRVTIGSWTGAINPVEFDAKIDTGAARSVVPHDAARFFGFPPIDKVLASLADGRTTALPVYQVALCVPGLPACRMHALATNRETILIGMDMLEALGLVLVCDCGRSRFSLGSSNLILRVLLRLLRR